VAGNGSRVAGHHIARVRFRIRASNNVHFRNWHSPFGSRIPHVGCLGQIRLATPDAKTRSFDPTLTFDITRNAGHPETGDEVVKV
jgi:hypothetical protein